MPGSRRDTIDSSEVEGGGEGPEGVARGVKTVNLDVVLGAWGNGWDWEGHAGGPDGSWVGGWRGLVEFLVVDLGSEEIALELELSDLDWVGGGSRHVEDTVSVELGWVWGSLGLVHEDLEVLHASSLDEGEWGGHGWVLTKILGHKSVHLLSSSDSGKGGVSEFHLFDF